MSHYCLATGTGLRDTRGDQFDCPACRGVLLESFREPACVPQTPAATPAVRPGDGCLEPGLCTLGDPCPVCDPEPDEPGLTGHVTHTRLTASSVQADWGFWYAFCDCGWRTGGVYGPPVEEGRPLPVAWRAVGPDNAQRLADQWAEHHKQNPIKEQT